MRSLWRRLVAFGFRLLYNELAWLYDPVSWIVSLGRWRRWQATIWPYLPPGGRVLEVGSGPGHLLVELSTRGYQVVGLDLSPAMLRLTRRRLGRRGLTTPVCRARATALPFAPRLFDAVILTFPTEFIYDPACIHQLARALKDGGRLVVAETCRFQRRDLLARCLEWLYRITGQRSPAPDLPARLDQAGLAARRERVEVDGSSVTIVLAEKRTPAL
jgi:ubiquinone/menaquinone biosynthesis C-methylase UbiE